VKKLDALCDRVAKPGACARAAEFILTGQYRTPTVNSKLTS
jgi:hypothetical protein